MELASIDPDGVGMSAKGMEGGRPALLRSRPTGTIPTSVPGAAARSDAGAPQRGGGEGVVANVGGRRRRADRARTPTPRNPGWDARRWVPLEMGWSLSCWRRWNRSQFGAFDGPLDGHRAAASTGSEGGQPDAGLRGRPAPSAPRDPPDRVRPVVRGAASTLSTDCAVGSGEWAEPPHYP